MQIVEVIPTHDEKGDPNQVFETPDGKAFDLRWPFVLVVHAPPAKPQPARTRHPREPPAILRKGEAADFGDAVTHQSDLNFLRALKAEYERKGTRRSLRDRVKAAPHQSLQATPAQTKPWKGCCDDFGGAELLRTLAHGSPPVQYASLYDRAAPTQMGC
ncbi:hypothetical protein CYMTET_48786 [Cymbomonas tetramitiformis]|uniref:Uncharacterized protein n=1 Tax=Cymbomonas tetramitiformis TaxID=36881 RepID=A0AAE0EV68_9CHLO|nr:hypothetical protein CYMTET_48786 [Cymbomonas tetramitiformis]